MRDERIRSLFGTRAKSMNTLVQTAHKQWGYEEWEVRLAIINLDCRLTPSLRVRLPRDNEPETPEWSGA